VKLVALLAIALCLREMKGQLVVASKVLADFHARQKIAAALATALHQDQDREQRCFSDDPAVRVLSGISPDRFLRSETAPLTARESPGAFENYLRQKRATYLVFTPIENSLPVKFFPDLDRGGNAANLHLINFASSPYANDIRLYRLRE
jgi:hypothetical protein